MFLLYSISRDSDALSHFVNEWQARGKEKHKHGLTTVTPKLLYMTTMLALHPDKTASLKYKFCDLYDEVLVYWNKTVKAFTVV